jgi:hypothetical protein
VARGGPVAVRAAKEAVERGAGLEDMAAALAVERQCYANVRPAPFSV